VTVAPAAYVVAAAAGLVTAFVAAVAMRGGPRRAVFAAAAARGLAVALAAFAAFAPVVRTTTRAKSETLVAAPRGVDVKDATKTVHWPDDAPDAATAVETLRASRDAGSPANLVLATGADVGRGRDLAPSIDALRRGDDGVDRYVVALPSPTPPAPLGPAPRILAPAGATDGVPVVLTLDAGDAPFAAGAARVSIDGHAVEVPLADGARRAVTPPLALSAGAHVVVAETSGRLPAAAVVDVAGPPRVVFVSADDAARNVVAMLRTQGMDVAEVRATDLKTDDVERCAAVVLGPGVAGESLAGAVAARVRGGAGLLVFGGEGTRGLTRFKGGALDAVLPVVPPEPPPPKPEPPVPPPPVKKPDPTKPKPALDEGEKKALRVALLLVIDTSGSMSIAGKLHMAQQSAIAAARSLSAEDRVEVIAFDEDARVVAPFQDAVELDTLARRIAGLRASGGTNFFPALKVGYRDILEQPCGIRHVILLTDGDTRPAVFRDLVEKGVEQKVTLSTVAIGDDADTDLLARLAGWGKGQLYNADDPGRLPEIVTLDTRRFTTEKRDQAMRERPHVDPAELPQAPADAPPVPKEAPTTNEPPREVPVAKKPHVASTASLLAGLESVEWPALPHPESAVARPASQVVLAWDDGAPALTLGRAGVGRVAVVSADAASDDAREFRRWEQAPRFLAQLVRGLIEPPTPGAPPVEARFVEADDGRAFVRVDVAGGGVLGLDALAAGASTSVRLVDRGDYSIAELAAMPPAGVFVGTYAPTGGAPRRATAVSPGPRGLSPDVPRKIAEASGAKIVDRAPPPSEGPPVEHDQQLAMPLVASAAGLLVVEALLRRLARNAA
jgi:hypothetical protein